MSVQWVAYQVVPGAMLTAPLPSAPEVGDGWRGVELRRVHPLDQFDPLVEETGFKSDAAFGLHEGASFAYAVATSRRGEPVRVVFGVDPSKTDAEEADVVRRCGVTGTGKRWRTRTAASLASWSVHAPRRVTSAQIEPLLAPGSDAHESVGTLLGLLGLAPPAGAIPDPLDLQDVAREQLAVAGEAHRRRWFDRGR